MKEQKADKALLITLREIFPFLQVIPDTLYFHLGTKELHLPSPEMLHLALELSEKLNHHVMTYNAHVFDTSIRPAQHLCALVQGAILSEKQLRLLASYEQETRKSGVTLVVYQKPAVLAKIKETALYQYYATHELL